MSDTLADLFPRVSMRSVAGKEPVTLASCLYRPGKNTPDLMRDALLLAAVAATRALPVEYWAGGSLTREEVREAVYTWRTLAHIAHSYRCVH